VISYTSFLPFRSFWRDGTKTSWPLLRKTAIFPGYQITFLATILQRDIMTSEGPKVSILAGPFQSHTLKRVLSKPTQVTNTELIYTKTINEQVFQDRHTVCYESRSNERFDKCILFPDRFPI
jgi:hypothetical protein